MSDNMEKIVAEGLKAGLTPAAAPVKEGNPAAGILENIPSWKVFGLSVGDAVKGMAAAGVGDVLARIIAARLPANIGGGVNTNAAIAKGLAAFAFQTKQVKGFMGANAANIGSLLLTIDAVNDLVQVRTSVGNLVGRFTGSFLPGSGLVWGRGPEPKRGNAVDQAGKVVEATGAIWGGN